MIEHVLWTHQSQLSRTAKRSLCSQLDADDQCMIAEVPKNDAPSDGMGGMDM